ncbi:MAG: 16S rRNA (guanine(527)-N(7))-methyltransferase RsmG [Pyrinomonadaceae bacterium]
MNALARHAGSFDLALTEDVVRALREYFEMVTAWNKRLHLVAPCPPAEFATRHVLESLLALNFLDEGARLVDVGSGGGLPFIPCLIARPDISGTLFESSQKKAVFLREALHRFDRRRASHVVAERFENATPPAADVLTCRALDRFTELFPALVSWSSDTGQMLLFGGPSLRAEIERAALPFDALLIPETQQRFLFIVSRTPLLS